MVDENKSALDVSVGILSRLMTETGITEAQARELIALLGLNWSSLLREARLLKR
ncbi:MULTISPECIES: hypothetical protein [unclassified Mesorhizobium]|jgi:hypothetical protein|uniref:hypothetical protein n=1 Tax=unclassified Mesorhizobium TaxID=325217 RepID=UPI000AEB5503|nr:MULTISPECIES: hypothetical protein [unclassified Mesorhizobium]